MTSCCNKGAKLTSNDVGRIGEGLCSTSTFHGKVLSNLSRNRVGDDSSGLLLRSSSRCLRCLVTARGPCGNLPEARRISTKGTVNYLPHMV